MVSPDILRETRAAIERRLVRERMAFFGMLAAFFAVLALDLSGQVALDPLVYILIIGVALTGAGYDGAREAVRDLELVAGFLEHEGPGARIAKMPFFMRGHYEIWFEVPSALGPRTLRLMFANSLFLPKTKNLYSVVAPVPPGEGERSLRRQDLRLPPYQEDGVGGLLEGRRIVHTLGAQRAGAGGRFSMMVFVRPGRPMDLATLLELRRRAEDAAEKIAEKGRDAIPWGRVQRFHKPKAEEIAEESRVKLAEGRE